MNNKKTYIIAALKTAIIYGIFGGLWILLSDKLLGIMVSNLQTYASIQTYKGWLYILVTSLLIFHLTHKGFQELASSQDDLSASEERYRLAAKAAGVGTWEWDIATGDLILNTQYLEAIGYNKSNFFPTLDNWKALIHPEDADRIHQAIDDHLSGKTPSFSARYRLLTSDEHWQWVQVRGEVFLWDEDGHPLKAVGVQIPLDDKVKCSDPEIS